MDFVWEVWVDSSELPLVNSESRIAPRRRASEDELHNMPNERVPKTRLYAVWKVLQSRDLELAVLISVSPWERQGEDRWLGDRACLEVLLYVVSGLVVLRVELEWQRWLSEQRWLSNEGVGAIWHGVIEQAGI